jgi:DNA-binding NarL/FixJ family response regulator
LNKIALWIYLANVVISFDLKRLGIVAFLIHLVYVKMFQIKMNYVFAINKPEKLNLTEDEKAILSELAKGKLQKEIELFSEQTITHKLKNARERNMCNSTAELVSKFQSKI